MPGDKRRPSTVDYARRKRPQRWYGLKFIRFVICVVLASITWPLLVLFSLNVALLEGGTNCPSPKQVYNLYREAITDLAKGTLEFVKKEIF